MEGDLSPDSTATRGPPPSLGQQPSVTTSALPQILDITQARPLRDSLTALSDGRVVVLDASAVERMSTPCAQVLLAAGRAAGSTGNSFRILDPSAVFRAALDDLGLQTEFSQWME